MDPMVATALKGEIDRFTNTIRTSHLVLPKSPTNFQDDWLLVSRINNKFAYVTEAIIDALLDELDLWNLVTAVRCARLGGRMLLVGRDNLDNILSKRNLATVSLKNGEKVSVKLSRVPPRKPTVFGTTVIFTQIPEEISQNPTPDVLRSWAREIIKDDVDNAPRKGKYERTSFR
jgi:hypothetical protein